MTRKQNITLLKKWLEEKKDKPKPKKKTK